MQKKNLLLATSGIFIEYFDYALFGFSAALIATHFFPSQSEADALHLTYIIYCVSHFSKPFGARILGHIGDTFGRKKALQLSMLGIAIPTLIIGFLPGFNTIGWMAVIILIFCRLLQGLFIAGEYDGVVIYMLEHVPSKNACFAKGLIGLTYGLGITTATVLISLSHYMPYPNLNWRLPFIIGGILALIVLLLRKNLTETPIYKELQNNNESIPNYKTFLKNNWQNILLATIVCASVGGCYHFYFVFFMQYLSTFLHMISKQEALNLTIISVLCFSLSAPVIGLIADKIGLLKTFKIGWVCLIGCIVMHIYMIKLGFIPLWLILCTTFSIGFFTTPGYVLLFNRFSTDVRYRGLTLGHGLASMCISGTAPLIATTIWRLSGNSAAPLYYFLLFPLLGSVLFFVYRNYEKDEPVMNLIENEQNTVKI